MGDIWIAIKQNNRPFLKEFLFLKICWNTTAVFFRKFALSLLLLCKSATHVKFVTTQFNGARHSQATEKIGN